MVLTDAPKPHPRRLKLHKVRAGQDFGVQDFDFGTEGCWFDVKEVGEALQCTADGYGKPGDYGNGAIYLRRCWTPQFFPGEPPMKTLSLKLTRDKAPDDDQYLLDVDIQCECGARILAQHPWKQKNWYMVCANCKTKHELVLPIGE